MQPQLTVCVPSYNVESCLPTGLETLALSRFAGRLEVIVVDDGSSDGTRQVADRYAERCPEVVRVVSQENAGHGGAVNTGLALARGRYFRVVDGDDWVDVDGLDALLDALAGLSSDLVVDWRCDVRMGTGEREPRPLPAGVPVGECVPLTTVSDVLARSSAAQIHTVNASTDFARGLGLRLLERTFYEDSQYVIELTSQARTVTFLDIEVYQYQVGNASQSVAAPNYVRRFADHDRVVRRVAEFAEERLLDPGLEEARAAYVRERARLLVNTHYNIMLVYDDDRRRGRARAREFRSWLASEHPWLKKATDRRYYEGLALGAVGGSARFLDRVKGRMAHEA